jgi:hypothetical protein
MSNPDVLWQRIVERLDAPPQWTWFDVGVAAAVAAVLLLVYPDSLWLLAYYL